MKIDLGSRIAEKQKIFLYCVLNGKFKNWNEIENGNNRIIKQGKKMLKQGLLIEDKEGFKNLNYEKYSILEEINEKYIRPNLINEENIKPKIGLRERKDIHKKIKFKKATMEDVLNKCIESGVDFKKEIDVKKLKKSKKT